MPSLQIDVPRTLDVATKQSLATRFGVIYAVTMDAEVDLITVSIHDLGSGSVWRCTAGDPLPHTLIMCDVRRGRPVETRADLARQLIDACVDLLGLDPHGVKVEFTQHSGDEMFHSHRDGFNEDWSPGESTTAPQVP